MGKIDIEGYTELRALSVRQPWAALIAGGAKRIENRKWPLSMELPEICLIQAGLKKPSAQYLAEEVEAQVRKWAEPDRRKARRILDAPDNWEYGALVALVRFSRFTGNQHDEYQWHIDKVQRVAATPVKGQLRLFKVPVAKVKLL